MSKKVQITTELQNKIRNAVGDQEMDTSSLAVYESSFTSTEPLQKGGIFHKARISPATLHAMVDHINSNGTVPLHIMHNDRILPVGKVFSAKVMNRPNGELELRGQFYVSGDESELIYKIENSTIDEVSVGILAKQILCSECNFDYRGEESTFMNILEGECDKGHKIGVDGVHTRLVGLEDWMELSLVGTGAANNPKILSRAKQSMSKGMLEQLAAGATPIEAFVLKTSYNFKTHGENTMEMKDILAKLDAQATSIAEGKVALKSLTDSFEAIKKEKEALVASKADLEAKIVELEASKDTGKKELEDKLAKVEATLSAATEALAPHVKAALVASGASDSEVPEDLEGQIKLVADKGLKLHQIIKAGATSADTKEDLKASSDDIRKNSFKLSK